MSSEHEDMAIRLYGDGKTGLSIEQIANRLGYGKSTIHRHLMARGIKCVRRSPGKPHSFNIDAAWRHFTETGDVRGTALKFGKSVNCMRLAPRRRAAKLRKAGE